MNGARRFNLTGVLAVVCVSWTWPVFAGQQTMEDSQERQATAGWQRTIVAQVDNYAEISPRDLAEAEQQAARIYEAIGVRMICVHGEVPLQDPRGLRVRVLLLSGGQHNVPHLVSDDQAEHPCVGLRSLHGNRRRNSVGKNVRAV